MPETVPPVRVGDPEMTIELPAIGDTLRLRVSVFGKCSEINAANPPTMTATLTNDGAVVHTVESGSIVMNTANQTYEAMFNLPSGTSVPDGKGKVEVSCS